MTSQIPILDIFAGPGGLGEGFSRYSDQGRKPFKIHLSIEMEKYAHETLRLRAFFRSFRKAPHDYFKLMRGECALKQLYDAWPGNYAEANNEAWQATLGVTPDEEIDARIRPALQGQKEWVLVGGPPCQAYSIVGRSRNRGINAEDVKVGLYRQYLKLVAKYRPTVFVMENVKGLLSANLDGSIFDRILADLGEPGVATGIAGCPGYRIHSFVQSEQSVTDKGRPVHEPMDFLIRSEDYGIPQARHRVILLGIRKDVEAWPIPLRKHSARISCSEVISDLPRIRSGLSKEVDSFESWSKAIHAVSDDLLKSGEVNSNEIRSEVDRALQLLKNPRHGRGGEFVAAQLKDGIQHAEWYLDDRIGGIANHAARTHIAPDVRRYFFAACYARAHSISPKLEDFPRTLLPAHKNVGEDGVGAHFSDRFRVQLQNRPATTVTSHISKDGHYFIHFDPTQCRSLTVREAARIQTFPDNYFFCGNRTQQYQQVGNAVPPLLAKRLAGVVWRIMESRT